MNYKQPKIVFSDFDGTLTYGSRFISTFFHIMELLEKNKVPLVIITGRSISWGHFLLTHFPFLKHIITEGGGNLIWVNEKGLMEQEFLVDEDELHRLEAFVPQLLRDFPQLTLSADSLGRKSDRAIELCELEEGHIIQEVQAYMDEHNVNHSTSNVHLNFWCGDISKANSFEYYMQKYAPDTAKDEVVFFGDSLNDQTIFKLLPHTVGVSNIEEVITRMDHKPTVTLEGEGNQGPYGVYSYLMNYFS